ncbi:YceI family protein [Geofilum sp. OHC36d9]|uniref:YceI family protein n=1 Tax=Geofilum sp. OHC36d9 TaxID=3458413 RepID=UPI004034B197
MKIRKSILLLMLITSTFPLLAQQQLNCTKGDIVVAGTSTIHDWEMEANTFKASATMTLDNEGITTISNAVVTIITENLKSESSSMDDKAYEALKSEKFKTISFQQTSDIKTQTSRFTAQVKGNMTIAGQTKPVLLNVSGHITGSKEINIAGTIKLKMTSFGVEPPKAMMGAIKSGDEVTIEFKTTFK